MDLKWKCRGLTPFKVSLMILIHTKMLQVPGTTQSFANGCNKLQSLAMIATLIKHHMYVPINATYPPLSSIAQIIDPNLILIDCLILHQKCINNLWDTKTTFKFMKLLVRVMTCTCIRCWQQQLTVNIYNIKYDTIN